MNPKIRAKEFCNHNIERIKQAGDFIQEGELEKALQQIMVIKQDMDAEHEFMRKLSQKFSMNFVKGCYEQYFWLVEVGVQSTLDDVHKAQINLKSQHINNDVQSDNAANRFTLIQRIQHVLSRILNNIHSLFSRTEKSHEADNEDKQQNNLDQRDNPSSPKP